MVTLNNYRAITVALAHKPYSIYLAEGLLQQSAWLQQQVQSSQVFIVTNKTVAAHYLAYLTQAFAGHQCDYIILPDGEQYKNLQTLQTIFDALISKNYHRDSTVLALGGGVIGDMAGFAAACYQRGVKVIQLPTTLLAQVDAAIGGKTGVNHPGGKNMIGAFYQPQSVIIDIATLKTLPPREFKAGLAEVIKYGLLADDNFFTWLEHNLAAILQLSVTELSIAIARCCELKATIVAADEKEADIRALLNLGHTFAHAIEAATHYQHYLHGEAVAIGLHCASLLSHYLGNLEYAHVMRIHTLLKAAGLPTTIPHNLDQQQLLTLMLADKKVLENKLRLVVLKTIGNAYVTEDMPLQLIRKVLTDACQEPNEGAIINAT